MIQSLIDKQDNFEIVGAQIAAILATEVANQKALAIAGGKDPALWDLKIYSERANPWERYLNENPDKTPIVNVWYDTSNFDPTASDIVQRQKADAVYNIDCYGFGVDTDVPGGGHAPGDLDAALTLHRALRLVRNVLMASEYTYLSLRGLVWRRWARAAVSFQPPQGDQAAQSIAGARIAFEVGFSEFSPQYTGVELDLISVDVLRTEDGQIVVEADYDFT